MFTADKFRETLSEENQNIERKVDEWLETTVAPKWIRNKQGFDVPKDIPIIGLLKRLENRGFIVSDFSARDEETKMMMGVMEVVDFNAYDLKYLSDSDISYNPALGTGQIQVRDIHYVTIVKRTTWEFCQLLDKKFIASKKGYGQWLEYAQQNNWIK